MLLNRNSISALVVVAALTSSPVLATPFGLDHIIENPTPGDFEDFGYSVDVSNGRAIIGQNFDRSGRQALPGSVYIVDAATGLITTTLVNPISQGNRSQYFGSAVGLDNNLAAVGSWAKNGVIQNQGGAYIFDATTGALISTIENPDVNTARNADGFGRAIDISGTNVVVGNGSLDLNPDLTALGAAYIFDALTGDLVHTLVSPDINEQNNFGHAVAIDGDLIAVGAKQEGRRTKGGAVHLYDANTGDFFSTLENPFPSDSDDFGWSVAVNDGKVLVGARNETPGSIQSEGGAYLFDAATGNLLQTFFSPDPERFGYFGSSVSLSDEYAAIGSVAADFGSEQGAGAAFIFDAVTGDLVQSIPNPFPTRGDQFTSDLSGIAIEGSTLVIGAQEDNATGEDSGRAYIYRTGLGNPDPDPAPMTVPSPGAALLLGFGLLGLATTRRHNGLQNL